MAYLPTEIHDELPVLFLRSGDLNHKKWHHIQKFRRYLTDVQDFYHRQDRFLFDWRHKHRCLGLIFFIFDLVHDFRKFTEALSNYWLQVPVDNFAFLSHNFLLFFIGNTLNLFSCLWLLFEHVQDLKQWRFSFRIYLFLLPEGGRSFLVKILFTLDEAVQHVQHNFLIGSGHYTNSSDYSQDRD